MEKVFAYFRKVDTKIHNEKEKLMLFLHGKLNLE